MEGLFPSIMHIAANIKGLVCSWLVWLNTESWQMLSLLDEPSDQESWWLYYLLIWGHHCCGTVLCVTISLHFCGRKFLRLLRISVPRIQGSRVDTRTIGEPSWWGGKTHPDWWHRIQTLSLLTDIPPTALCWWVTRECLLWGGGVRPGSHTDHSRDTARCLYSILYTET